MNNNIDRMILNAGYSKDKEYNTELKYIVLKYVENDISLEIEAIDLHDMIVKAYKLFLEGELHGIVLVDKNGNSEFTDSLNYFKDNSYLKQLQEIEEIKRQLEIYKQFMKMNKIENTFNDFKKALN